jgi:hypothetical protein
MIRLQEKGSIIIIMVQNIRDSGSMINNTAMEDRYGLMEASIKDIIIWARRVGRANTFGRMVVHTRETG